jgi:endonuclease G
VDQSDVIAKFGIEATAPFGAYKTFQVPISEIERLTGLQFTYGKNKKALSDLDPLAKGTTRKRRGVRTEESLGTGELPTGYVPLAEFSDIALST